MVICAGHEHSTCGGARSGGMEVGEAETISGQAVDVGSSDLAAETAWIGESKVVGEDDEEIGTFGFCGSHGEG